MLRTRLLDKKVVAAVLAAPVVVLGGTLGTATATAAPVDHREGLGSATGTDGLDPLLALAYTMATDAARAESVPLSITSGYRTRAEQQAMWEEGLATYGSPEEARRWVLPPDESTHVTGRAIDVGPRAGAQWLETNGNRWGLCRTFLNEWWHFELVTVPGGACPAMLPDAGVR